MIRRSRISVRPNVSTRPAVSAGKPAAAGAAPSHGPAQKQEAREANTIETESNTAVSVTDASAAEPPENDAAAARDRNEQTTEGTSSQAAPQRRKRFAVKPKVATGRVSLAARAPKSPVKLLPELPAQTDAAAHTSPDPSKPCGTSAPSPRSRRPSDESTELKEKAEPTVATCDETDSLADSNVAAPSAAQPQTKGSEDSPVLDDSLKAPDKVPPSLPVREAPGISEKAKSLVSSDRRLSTSAPKCSLSRLLNDPSDLQRLEKARKLRELLRQEIHKEKKLKKSKARAKEYTLDPAKMTMRDLIHYLPLSNPMTSLLEDCVQEDEAVVTPLPVREDSPESAQEPSAPSDASKPASSQPKHREDEEPEELEEAAEAEGEEDEPLLVPQVKVAEDGSLIIDEESLTVEVQRAKGPNPCQERDPIFERGSTTTYSSFRKGTYTKPWSNEETDMFFLAISMVGTDFSMVCQLFPHRARSEIKNKFKKEERQNAWRIDKAFRERRKLDLEYFSKLLEKILEYQKTKKKLKSVTEKNPQKRNRKRTGKRAVNKLSDVEEEDAEEQDENEGPDLEEEDGEKENEGLSDKGWSSVAPPKKKYRRRDKTEASAEEPNTTEMKAGGPMSELGDVCIPEDREPVPPQDHTKLDKSEKSDMVTIAKGTTVPRVGLSRGRAPKPLLPPARKSAAELPEKAGEESANVIEDNTEEEASKSQVSNAAPDNAAEAVEVCVEDLASEGEDSSIVSLRPTRYGRIPKPNQHFHYLDKDDKVPSVPENTSGTKSPSQSTTSAAKTVLKGTVKRGRPSKLKASPKSKRPKLVTLRASQSEYSDDEDERQREEEEEEEVHDPASCAKEDSSAPVFVPIDLRSPEPVMAQVEETMEELDILATQPDVLNMSHEPLCADSPCGQVHHDTGTFESREHQLDLLVGVIDLLSSDTIEDETYNEAAQTLLTIGHMTQSTQGQVSTQEDALASTSVITNEAHAQQPEKVPSNPAEVDVNRIATKAAHPVAIVGANYDVTASKPLNSKTHAEKSEDTSVMQAIPNVDPAPQPTISTISKHSSISKDVLPQSAPEEISLKMADCGSAPGMIELSRTEIEVTNKRVTPAFQVKSGEADSAPRPSVSGAQNLSLEQTTESTKNEKCSSEFHVVSKAPAQQFATHQTEDDGASSTSLPRKTRFHKVKPKPNLGQKSRALPSKGHPVEGSSDSASLSFPVKTPTNGEERPDSCINTQALAAFGLHSDPVSQRSHTHSASSTVKSSAAEGAKTSSPPDDQKDSNSKNLSHGVPEKLSHNAEQQIEFAQSELESTENTGMVSLSCSSKSGETVLERSVQITEEVVACQESLKGRQQTSDCPAEHPKPTHSPSQRVGVGSSRCTTQTMQCMNQRTDPEQDPADESKMAHAELKRPDTVQQCVSESIDLRSTAEDSLQSPQRKSQPTHVPKSTKEAPPTRRARLTKPKPNLGNSVARHPQHIVVQKTTQAESDPGGCSKTGDGGNAVAQGTTPVDQRPVDEIVKQVGGQTALQKNACHAQSSEIPTHECSVQDRGAPSTGDTSSSPAPVMFEDMLQVPSDPEEPFFILSLTEIPVTSSDETRSRPEKLNFPSIEGKTPVVSQSLYTDTAQPEGRGTGGDRHLSTTIESEPKKKSGNATVANAGTDHTRSTSSGPQEAFVSSETHAVQPHLPKSEGIAKDDASTNEGPEHRRERQIQKQGNAVAAEEAEPIPIMTECDLESEQNCTSVQPDALAVATADNKVSTEAHIGCADHVHKEKDTRAENREDGSLVVQTSRSTSSQILNRKPKGFLSFLSGKTSSASPGRPLTAKVAPRAPAVRIPSRKPSVPALVASTLQDSVDPSSSSPSVTARTRQTAKCTSDSLKISAPPPTVSVEDSSEEDEPLGVSQYFLTDIFTEVDEG